VPVSAVKVDKTKPPNDQIADSLNAVPSAPGAVSGVPDEHRVNRRVRIYQPAKMATQSGDFSAGVWLIDYENRQRWENQCMGWGSTGDAMSNVQVKFNSKEQAIKFAESMGYSCDVDEELPTFTRDARKTYGANFSWNKRTRTNTK